MDKDEILQVNSGYWEDTWGYCGPDCPTHEETLAWNTDTTLKMTLQYDKTVLFSGLKLYGMLLAGILICGLTIVLLPALGKITVQSIFTMITVYINSSHDEVRQDGRDGKVLGLVLE